MKILCTGGAGYVGSACVRWLLATGHDAVAFDNLCEGNRKAVPSDRLIVGDIGDRSGLVRAMKTHGSDAVMHFAAVASVPQSLEDPEAYWRVNLIGTKNVLDAMHERGIKRIVFSSTAATYEFDSAMPLKEESPQLPGTPYGTSKLAAEKLIGDYCRAYGIGCAILRYFNASGADPDGEHGEDRLAESHLIPLILYVPLKRREKLLIYGADWNTRDGTCIRDFVHTQDLAQGHQLVIEQLEPGVSMTFNLGSGRGTTVLEVLRACEEVVGASICHEFVARRPGDPAVLVASPDKIQRELGWEPRHGEIRQIVETAWRWHKARPSGYGGRRSSWPQPAISDPVS